MGNKKKMGKEIIIGSAVALIGAANILNRRRGKDHIHNDNSPWFFPTDKDGKPTTFWFFPKEKELTGCDKHTPFLKKKCEEELVKKVIGSDCSTWAPSQAKTECMKNEEEKIVKMLGSGCDGLSYENWLECMKDKEKKKIKFPFKTKPFKPVKPVKPVKLNIKNDG